MTVLIVDDVIDNRITLSLLLEDVSDVAVLEASNGHEALEICKNNLVDVVFMDVMMPVMDGVEATRLISSLPKKPIIIAVSALNDSDKKREMLKAGAQDYLTKPINDKLFIARIKNYKKIIASLFERDLKNEWAVNPFSRKVYAKKILFRITNESSLGELWETFLLGNYDVTDNMSDCIRAVYSAGSLLLKNHLLFDIIVEESDDSFYFTFTRIENYNRDQIYKVITKNFPTGESKFGSMAFSMVLEKSKRLIVSNSKEEKMVSENIATIPKEAVEDIELKQEEAKFLRETVSDKISAQEFLLQLESSYFDKIETLVEKEDELDASMFELETSGHIEFIYRIASSIEDYILVIDSLYEFEKISFSLRMLSGFLQKLTNEDLADKKIDKLTLILKNLFADLTDWRRNIFSFKIAQDIHYLDSSLISSCMQIESIFVATVQVESEDDLELF